MRRLSTLSRAACLGFLCGSVPASGSAVAGGLLLHHTFEQADPEVVLFGGELVDAQGTPAARFGGGSGSSATLNRVRPEDIAGNVTVMVWLRLEADPYPAPAANWTVFDCEEYKQSGCMLRVLGTERTLNYRASREGAYADGRGRKVLNNNRWYHVALSRAEGTVTLYVNGRRDASFEAAPPTPPTKTLHVSAPYQSFQGLVHAVTVHGRALSAPEIADAFGRAAEDLGITVNMQPLVVDNGRLALTFDAVDYHLTSMRAGSGPEHISPVHQGDNALWEIDLRSNLGKRGYERVLIDASATASTRHEVTQTDGGGTLCRLFWKGMDVVGESNVLDVVATIRLPRGSERALWTLAISNRSEEFGIWEFRYPRLLAAPPDPDLKANYFLNTINLGQVVPDPYHVDPDANGNTRNFWHQRLGVYHAGQFMALYGGNRQGVYYSARDAEGWMKIIEAFFHSGTPCTEFNMTHSVLHMAHPGADFAMAYPVVAGLFSGDWYDACRIYRRWAVAQPWCAKGPVAQRRDIPQWLKDCSLVVKQSTRLDAAKGPGKVTAETAANLNDNTTNYLRCLELFGEDIASLWYAWWLKTRARSAADEAYLVGGVNGNDGQLVQPIPGVREANRRISEAGGHPLAYFNATLFDMGAADEVETARACAEHTAEGDPEKAYDFFYSMCMSTDWWRARYAEVVRRAIKDFGFRGIYMDSLGKPWGRCFATHHGHAYGGTRDFRGQRAFARHMYGIVKALDPEAVTSAENCTEAFIDVVDTRLSATILQEHVAPIYPAVYHDYQLYYGRVLNPRRGARLLRMTAGYCFAYGGQLGRYTISDHGINWDDPQHADLLAFFQKLIATKRAAREFLNLGEMLRPPALVTEVPTLTQQVWYQKQTVALPAVLASAWKSPDGEVGLVFVNCHTETVDFEYRVDTVEYGFPSKIALKRSILTPDGRQRDSTFASGVITRAEILPPEEVRVVVLADPK